MDIYKHGAVIFIVFVCIYMELILQSILHSWNTSHPRMYVYLYVLENPFRIFWTQYIDQNTDRLISFTWTHSLWSSTLIVYHSSITKHWRVHSKLYWHPWCIRKKTTFNQQICVIYENWLKYRIKGTFSFSLLLFF